MIRNKNIITCLILFSGFIFFSCASQHIRFTDAEPVRFFNDIHPIPVPKGVHYDVFDYYTNVKPPRPTIKTIFVSDNKNARDVNSMDEATGSSWFIPRLGYYEISPDELVNGSLEYGPPVPPITIIRIRKPESNPRFFVYDKRGIYYLLKCDPPEYPFIATTTSLIVNRLFWGFGYNVPEDHLFHFSRDDIKIADQNYLTQPEIDTILTRIAGPVDNKYRCVASRIIKGLPLGPAPDKGVREDDPNDLFPHEERRVLRGLKIFCSFTNMSDISTDNLFDIYVGEPGKGYIKHYLIDFDDAFGTRAARDQQVWAGYNHLFDYKDITQNLLTAGLLVKDWERIQETPWKSIGTFESQAFKPEKWKETHPFTPIRSSQPADDYWAAKILGALSEEHITALVKAAHYPSPEASQYMSETLINRRHKILNYYLKRISAIDAVQCMNGLLYLQNTESLLLNTEPLNYKYLISYFTDNGKNKISPTIYTDNSALFTLPIPDILITPGLNYLQIHIQLIRPDGTDSPAAQFHLHRRNDGILKLVGVVH